MKKVLAFLAILLLALLGCKPNVSPDSYALGSVGQVNRVVRGTIISVRDIEIQGSESGVGTGAGAVAGGTAGSYVGGEDLRMNIIGAVGGAVAGGLAGSALEEGATKQAGYEYVIETANGALVTVVQGGDKLSEGENVLVLYGRMSRVIKDPKK